MEIVSGSSSVFQFFFCTANLSPPRLQLSAAVVFEVLIFYTSYPTYRQCYRDTKFAPY